MFFRSQKNRGKEAEMTQRERLLEVFENCPSQFDKEKIVEYMLTNGVSVTIPPTYEATLKVLWEVEDRYFKDNPIIFKHIEVARFAVQKQIPKKPLEENRYYGQGKCPTCGAVFVDKSTQYCGNCGQAMDWSD